MENNRVKLYTKILNVVSKMEAIEKSGYNSHQKYHYSTEEDMVNAIRNLMLENKLLVLTSSETKEVIKVLKGEKETILCVVNTIHKFIDTETGETEQVTSTGTGWDDTDKGSFKAITGAMKYFIGKNFLVPSKDDAENDGVTVSKPSKKETTPKIGAATIKVAETSPAAAKIEPKGQAAVNPTPVPAPVTAAPEVKKEEPKKAEPVVKATQINFAKRATQPPVQVTTKTEPNF